MNNKEGVVKKWLVAPALLVAVAAGLTAGTASGKTTKAGAKYDPTCGAARAASRTVNGTLGSVTIHGTPTRIVALEFSFVDDLAQVGITPVGIADDNDPTRVIPPVRAKLGKYTSVGLRQTPNLETIASLHPDLIIADATRHVNIYHQLEAIAPTIALDSLQEAYLPNLHAAIVVGQAVNKCGAMVRRVQQDKLIMARMKAAVMKATSGKGEHRRTMFVVDTNKIWNVHSNLAYTPSLLAAVGITPANVLSPTKDNLGNPYIPMSQEDFLSNNPDIIFAANNPPNALYDTWSKSPLWGQVNAVKNNQVYTVNTNLWSKARGLQAGELIAQQAVHLLYHKYVSVKLPNVSST